MYFPFCVLSFYIFCSFSYLIVGLLLRRCFLSVKKFNCEMSYIFPSLLFILMVAFAIKIYVIEFYGIASDLSTKRLLKKILPGILLLF